MTLAILSPARVSLDVPHTQQQVEWFCYKISTQYVYHTFVHALDICAGHMYSDSRE